MLDIYTLNKYTFLSYLFSPLKIKSLLRTWLCSLDFSVLLSFPSSPTLNSAPIVPLLSFTPQPTAVWLLPITPPEQLTHETKFS